MLHRDEVKEVLQQLYRDELNSDPEDVAHVEINDDFDFVIYNRERTYSVDVPRSVLEKYIESDRKDEQAKRSILDTLAFLGGTPASY